jgi:hypothetical protein
MDLFSITDVVLTSFGKQFALNFEAHNTEKGWIVPSIANQLSREKGL